MQTVSDTQVKLQGNHSVIKMTNSFYSDKDLCTNSIVAVLHMGCIAHRWLPQGTNLASTLKPHHNCNSGDKCNCQNNKSFFAVIYI